MDGDQIINYHVGYDSFTPDPGKWKTKRCKACGTQCDVERNCVGKRTRWGPSGSVFDVFSCPNSNVDWHVQLIKLHEAIKDMPSETVAGLMKVDLGKILLLHVNKDCWKYVIGNLK